MRRKITSESLDELRKSISKSETMSIIDTNEQSAYVGRWCGGDGTQSNPFSQYYFYSFSEGGWTGGHVEGMGYVPGDVYIYGCSNGESGGFNITNAINHLTSNAQASSIGRCAQYVRMALEAGGLSTDGRPVSAYGYADWLQTVGFSVVHITDNFQPGDIIVHAAIGTTHPHGHIAMFNGEQWISDFVQNDKYGGSAYRNNSSFIVLRLN
jgi:hypothetical protein